MHRQRIPKLLRQAYAKKFDEICVFLATQYGMDADPAILSVEQKAEIADDQDAQIYYEAEELVTNWEAACFGGRSLEVTTELQRLLAEHHKIGKRILKFLE